jgi:hypothetical protein
MTDLYTLWRFGTTQCSTVHNSHKSRGDRKKYCQDSARDADLRSAASRFGQTPYSVHVEEAMLEKQPDVEAEVDNCEDETRPE